MAYVPSKRVKALPKRKVTHRRDKPGWDDTLSDLSQHRATEEELARRRQVSRPPPNIRDELRARRLQNAQYAQSAVLRDILYAPEDIDDVLANSDKTIAMVDDLFGELPGKYSGVSSVTRAPNAARVLNHNESDEDHENRTETSSVFENSFNLDKYKQLLRQTDNERETSSAVSRDCGAGDRSRDPSSSETPRPSNNSVVSSQGDCMLILNAIEDLKSAVLKFSDQPSASKENTSAPRPFESNHKPMKNLPNIGALINNRTHPEDTHDDDLKTFDSLVAAVKTLTAEQQEMKKRLSDRENHVRDLENRIENQNSTIRAMAEDMLQMQTLIASWEASDSVIEN